MKSNSGSEESFNVETKKEKSMSMADSKMDSVIDSHSQSKEK